MHRKLFLSVSAVLVLGLSASSSAVCFNALLASYEPAEVNCLTVSTDPIKDPTLVARWPVLGGVNDVPPATEGEYVLELAWAGETDHKVEVKHEWICSCWFDLAGYDYIIADVYLVADSALPEIIGIWDDVFGWVSTVCLPCTRGQWYTVAFYVGNLEHMCLDHIFAFLFEKLAGDDGKIYVDNLRLLRLPTGMDWPHLGRKIKFSRYWWSLLQSDYPIGAGPNYYTDDPNDVWVDPNEHLHLSIVDTNRNWYCSEVIANANLGYGTYVFTVKGRGDLLDPNIVLGLFIYDVPDQGKHREIDVEISRWGRPYDPNIGQYVVQPWNNPGNRYRFPIDYFVNDIITHEITWLPDQIDFRSYYGDCPLEDLNDLIESWSYTGPDIPEPGCENPRLNFYLMGGDPPTNGQDAEIIIKSFQYLLNIPADIDIRPNTLNPARKGGWVTCRIRLGEGYNVADIDSCCILLEDRIKAEGLRFNKRKQVATAKFRCSKLQEILAELYEPGDVELTVRGQLSDGTRFKGKDTIRVIDKKGKK